MSPFDASVQVNAASAEEHGECLVEAVQLDPEPRVVQEDVGGPSPFATILLGASPELLPVLDLPAVPPVATRGDSIEH